MINILVELLLHKKKITPPPLSSFGRKDILLLWLRIYQNNILWKISRMKKLFALENNLSCFFSFCGATWEQFRAQQFLYWTNKGCNDVEKDHCGKNRDIHKTWEN